MGGEWGVGVRNVLYQIEVTIRKTAPATGTGAEQERSLRSAQPAFLTSVLAAYGSCSGKPPSPLIWRPGT